MPRPVASAGGTPAPDRHRRTSLPAEGAGRGLIPVTVESYLTL